MFIFRHKEIVIFIDKIAYYENFNGRVKILFVGSNVEGFDLSLTVEQSKAFLEYMESVIKDGYHANL